MSITKRLLDERKDGRRPQVRKKKRDGKKYRRVADVMLKEAKGCPWRIPYTVYLQTSHWRKSRSRTLRLDGWKCVKCGQKGDQVHHRTYERLGREHQDDIVTLCTECHLAIHEGKIPIDSVQRITKPGEKKKKSDDFRKKIITSKNKARCLRNKANRVLTKGTRDSDPEVQRVVDVYLKKQERGPITIDRSMKEMGYTL